MHEKHNIKAHVIKERLIFSIKNTIYSDDLQTYPFLYAALELEVPSIRITIKG